MKNNNLLLRIAQGDAYCIACEFTDHSEFNDILKLKKYYSHPKYKQNPGRYTDDGQMSLGLAEAILSGDDLLDLKTWAFHFLNAFKRDPRKAYAPGFQKFLENTETPEDFFKNIKPTSDKNGAAMRSVPLGVIYNYNLLIKSAKTQAKLTHNTKGGIASSVLTALMSHYTLYSDDSLNYLNSFLSYSKFYNKALDDLWDGRVAGDELGMKTVHAVNTLLRTQKSLTGIIKQTLQWGGDTDSVAAIALGIASSSSHIENDLPNFFDSGLENGKYGRDYLKKTGKKLMDRFYTPV